MKFLVTGGAGFIGSNLARRLLALGEVKVLDNLMLGREENVPARAELTKGSVMDEALVRDIVKGCDFIFHEAAHSSSPMFLENPQVGLQENTVGFMNVMNMALRYGVKRVIFASTSSMYSGNPTPYSENMTVGANTFYEASFRCREIIAQTYYRFHGLSSVALRYFSVYGPNENHKGRFANNVTQFLCEIRHGLRPEIYGDGTQTRDFIHVDDAVEANLLAMKSRIGFEIFNIGTGVGTNFNTLLSLICDALRKRVEANYIENPIKNYVMHTAADMTKSAEILGFKPVITLKEGIRRQIEHYDKIGWPKFPSH